MSAFKNTPFKAGARRREGEHGGFFGAGMSFFGLGRSPFRAGIIVFPGTNCDRDTKRALDGAGFFSEYIFHSDKDKISSLQNYDLIVIPGGFSFGDYVRAGRLAKLSPVMSFIKEYVKSHRGFVLGICNGFQILTEAGILKGALIENRGTKFISEDEKLVFIGLNGEDEEITLPVAHKEGCFWADDRTLKQIEEENMVFLRYKNNPNGSFHDIAGLYDRQNKVLALMPHPERAVSKVLGLTDGVKIFDFIKNEMKDRIKV